MNDEERADLDGDDGYLAWLAGCVEEAKARKAMRAEIKRQWEDVARSWLAMREYWAGEADR